MKKFKVIITEVLEMELEVEADTLEEAVKQVDQKREDAGKTIKELQTEEMKARIMHENGEEKTIRWI